MSQITPTMVVWSLLERGHTLAELMQKTHIPEDELRAILDTPRRGFDLFVQRNAFNEQVYIYIPEVATHWQPKKPVFKRKVADTTPWLIVQFPDTLRAKRIDLVPLYDVHYGHKSCNIQKFREYVEYIRSTPHAFTFLGGDLIEFSNKLSVAGGVYEQHLMPQQQITDMVEMLQPIAHKILFSISGNHEARSMKTLGVDVARLMADRLGVPYFDEPVHLDLNWRGYSWRIHAQHGSTSSGTEGGKLNAAKRPVEFQGDFTHAFFMGHVHDTTAKERVQIVRNYQTMELELRKYYIIIMPSFLGYFGTYAAQMGLAPPSSGSINFSIYPNGKYHYRV